MKQTNYVLLGILASVAMVSVIGTQNASAHQLAVLFGDDDTNNIFFVLGHTNEPSFGQDPGKHDGRHNIEIRLSDDATDLALADSEGLFVDKYYFKNVKKYNKAESVEDANAIETGINIRQAFGDPGHYIHNQVIKDGIYGYHVYGEIDYFGVGKLPVDLTFFCLADGMDDPAKFEGVAGGVTFGEFGCPQSINDIKFPKKGGHHNNQFDKDD